MLRRTAAWAGAVGAAVLISAAPTASAGARELSSTLEITVERPKAGSVERFWLNCDPDFGTHPRPLAACDRLRAVEGDFERLRSGAVFCPPLDDPVAVRITGTWRDRPVDFSERYTNDCDALFSSGPVVPPSWA
ncbi:SSI family serine proteinase inhibitor [Streptomonospora sp. PA3]|uniref:SSI family serine proteinase inhibitor n=1 Tax=Streptomonospora sp. PA3 TaxID=2607326 RepID=UPI001642F152|nr:SSI family serine proteinase inhibitor [Streptomonospora sp. PA3]